MAWRNRSTARSADAKYKRICHQRDGLKYTPAVALNVSSPLGACDGLSKEEIDNMSGSDSDEGRPRPIGAEQESEDDESDREVNSNEDGAKSAAAEGAAAAGAAAPGEEKKASKRIKIPAFSENNLITAKGLTKIYEDFPQKCQYKGRGREAEFLRGLMVAYKEWGYQLYRALAFEDLASRTEKLGGKGRTREFLRELRDKERDRVLKVEVGKSAKDDVRAEEAANRADQVNSADGGDVEKQKDSEEVETRLANSRYMDVDEEGEGEREHPSDKGPGSRSKFAAAPVVGALSVEVRARMEANRRLALERLRRKKEEAASALSTSSAGAIVGKSISATPLAADIIGKGVTEDDLMHLDAEELNGEPQDNFEDDEAALAEMEAEEPATKKSKLSVDTATPATTLLESNISCSLDKTFAPKIFEVPSLAVDTLPGSTERSPVDGDGGATHGLSTAPTDEATVSGRTGNGVVGKAVAPKPEGIDEGSTPTAHPAGSESSKRETTASKMCIPATSGDQEIYKGDVKSAEALTEKAAKAAADGSNGRKDKGISSNTAAAFGVMTGSVKNVGEILLAVSPQKCKATESEVPMSPLGRMLADTDIPAEGGSLAVRVPIAGLSADKP